MATSLVATSEASVGAQPTMEIPYDLDIEVTKDKLLIFSVIFLW